MSVQIILSVTYKGECMLISVNGASSFNDFAYQVCGKWPVLNQRNLECRFSVGAINNCFLESENDFMNLLSLCQLTSEKLIVVQILNGEGGGRNCDDDGGNRPNLHSRFNSYSPNDVSVDENDNIPILHSSHMQDTPDDVFVDENDQNISCGINQSYRCLAPQLNKVPFKCGKNKMGKGQQVEFGGKCSVPNYDICPPLKRKPLLSDRWSDIMQGGVGLVFRGGAVEFRSELIKYSAQLGFKFKYTRNERKYVSVVCAESVTCDCDWYIKAKLQPITAYFEVSKCNLVHKCVGNLVNDPTSRIGTRILGDLVLHDVRSNSTIAASVVMESLFHNYGMNIPYWKAWRTIEAARDQIFGSYEESYNQLRWYCSAIERTNPGSVVSLEYNTQTNCFERLFISFKACIDGFRKCRPMLFIDGTFMSGRAKGTLLSATAKDGDNGLFPVALAVVSSETTKNWTWFLTKMRDHIHHDKPIFYISDRNAGLMASFPVVFDEPRHFFCLYHLLTNLKGRFAKGWTNDQREKMCNYFKACAYAPCVRIFDRKIELFKKVGGPIAEEWLSQLPYDKWAVAHSPHITRYGEMTSNAAESFNSWIKEARGLPIMYMIDCIRTGISNWYIERRENSKSWTGALCPSKEELWYSLVEISRSWQVALCPTGEYLVSSKPSVVVNLRTQSCTCYQWQVKGFPCAHVVAVIRRNCPSVYTHVDECYYTTSYRESYSFNIHPIPETERFECETDVPHEKILPPVLKRPPGRPPTKRKPSYGEHPKRKKIFCTRCDKWGSHDAITCLRVPDLNARCDDM